MSRRSKNARLWLRPARYDKKTHVLTERATWIIRDRARFLATGCTADEVGRAEQKLAGYIAGKYSSPRRKRDIEEIPVADVLSIYYEDKKDDCPNIKKLVRSIKVLAHWWGGMMLSDVNGATCRAFKHNRATEGAMSRRREDRGSAREYLEVLRAAINHHRKEGWHRGEVLVNLPAKRPARDEWLTRRQAAALIRACWRARETQTIHRGSKKGLKRETCKYPLRHIARFILIGLYTGTRTSAILAASPFRQIGHAYVDLENGIYYRQEIGRKSSKEKPQTPVRLPRRLLAHMRRWHQKGIIKSHFVEWQGKPVKSVTTGFKRAVRLARLPEDINRHTLRHTCVTWLLQRGVPIWEVAGFVGMSPQMVEKVYGHHHPDHQRGAVGAFEHGPLQEPAVRRPPTNPTGRRARSA